VLMLLGERSRWLCRLFRPVLMPLSHAGMAATLHLRGRVRWLSETPREELRRRVEALEQDLLKRQEMIDGLQRKLEHMRQWESRLSGFHHRLIDAVVVAGEALPLRDRRLLGTGSRGGAADGDLVTTRLMLHDYPVAPLDGLTVLGHNYVVGRVRDPAAYSATLQLVTDPGFETPARILRLLAAGQRRPIFVEGPDGGMVRRVREHDGKTAGAQVVGEPVVVSARGAGSEVRCGHVPAHHDVRPGDLLTTPGSEGLPFRLPIGRVVRVVREADDAHYVTVHVKPAADLGALRDVYIVLPKARPGRP